MSDFVAGVILAVHHRGSALVEVVLILVSVAVTVAVTVGGIALSRRRTSRWRQQRAEAEAYWAAQAAVHEAPTWTGRPW